MLVLTDIVSNSPVIQDVVSLIEYENFSSVAKIMTFLTSVLKFVLAFKKSLDDP